MLSVSVTRRFAETVAVKGAGAEDDSWQRVGLATWNNICVVVAKRRRAILHNLEYRSVYFCDIYMCR